MANGLFLLFVVGLLVLVWFRPGAACGLTISGFVIEQVAQAFVPLAGQSDQLFNYIVGAAVVLAIVRQLFQHGPAALMPGYATRCALLLLGYIALTVLWSLFPSTTEKSLEVAAPYLVLFAFMSPLTVQSSRDISDALEVVIFGTSGALLLLLVFATWEARSVYLPYSGQASNPLALTQAAGSVLVAATMTTVVRDRCGRFFLPVAAAIALVVLLIFLRTQSRGQILGAAGVTALFVAVTRRGRVWLVVGALGFALIVASGFLQEEIASNAARWDQRQLAKDIGQDRLAVAEQLLDYWMASSTSHQVLGLGHAAAQDPRLIGSYPHVVPIEVLCEEGLVGAVFYTVTLLVAVASYWIAMRQSRATPLGAFLPAMFALYCYEFTLTLKQGTIVGNWTFLLFVVLSDSMRRISSNPEERSAAEHAWLQA